VLILAHRGLPGAAGPENSHAAIAAAFASGADGVEVDLRLTTDGVLVASHDPDLFRLAGAHVAVADTSWPVLDAAAAQRGLRLARLEELLVLAAGRPMVLELKRAPTSAAQIRTAAVLVQQLALLQRCGLSLDVTVSSFSPTLLMSVQRESSPGNAIRTALLGSPMSGAAPLLRHAMRGGHQEMHPNVLALLAETGVVEAAHARGISVVPWTVNRPRHLRRLERAGVDAVITDVPVTARAALASVPA